MYTRNQTPLRMGWNLLYLLFFSLVQACSPTPKICEQASDCGPAAPRCIQGRCLICQSDPDCPDQQQCKNARCIPDSPRESNPNEVPSEKTETTETTSQENTPEQAQDEPNTTKEPLVSDASEFHPEPPPEEAGCTPNQRRKCYTGPPSTQKQGECQEGIQYCQSDNTWSPCQGELLPQNEICDGKDNDCNGNIDDNLTPPPCPLQQGVCQGSTQICRGTQGWKACEASTYKQYSSDYQEIETKCDTKDNDCDGWTDILEPTATCNVTSQSGICRPGHQRCEQQKRVCRPNQTALPHELCGNQQDDNCDGSVDEIKHCSPFKLSEKPKDYALLQDGSVFVLLQNSQLSAECLRADGSSLRIKFPFETSTVAKGAGIPHGVWHLRKHNQILLLWSRKFPNATPPHIQSYFRIYDARCQALTPPQTFAPPIQITKNRNNITPFRNAAVNTEGEFVLASIHPNGILLSFYDKNHKRLGTPLNALPTARTACKNQGNSATVQLSMNAQGKGILTCSKYGPNYQNRVFYRRFDRDQARFLEPKPTPYLFEHFAPRTHTPSMNAQGGYTLGLGRTNGNDLSLFFDASNKYLGSTYQGAPPQQHFPRIGQDTLLFRPNYGAPHLLARYDSQGNIRAQTTLPKNHSMPRVSSQGIVYTLEQAKNQFFLHANSVSLALGHGVCQGKPCVCRPYETRPCQSLPVRLPLPCRGGHQICNPDGLGWSRCKGEHIPHGEICNNKKDDDCNGIVDDLCPRTNRVDPVRVDAYNVFHNDSIVTLYSTSKQIAGHCYHPNLNIKRALFRASPILSNIYRNSLRLNTAYQTGHFLVSWNSQNDKTPPTIQSRLYDANCNALTPIFDWGGEQATNNQTSPFKKRLPVTMDHFGRFAFLSRPPSPFQRPIQTAHLKLYNAQGKPSHPPVSFSIEICKNHTLSLTLHPSAKTGIIVCFSADTTTPKILARRFHLTKGFLDTKFQPLPSGTNPLAYTNLFLRFNHAGDLLLTYPSRKRNGRTITSDTYVNLYKAGTSLRRAFKLGPAITFNNSTQHWQSYDDNMLRVLLWKNDFVVRTGKPSKSRITWYRISPQGKLKSQASITGQHNELHPWGHSLRIANDNTYLVRGTPKGSLHYIQRNILRFQPIP